MQNIVWAEIIIAFLLLLSQKRSFRFSISSLVKFN